MKIQQCGKGKVFPLQVVLVVPFVVQIFATVSLVSYLSFKNGQTAVNDLAEQLIARSSDTVSEHLKSYLAVPQTLNQINADAIRRGMLNVRDRKAAGQYFWDQMQAYDLTYIGIGLTTGAGVGAGRYDGKTITIDEWTGAQSRNNTNYATDPLGKRIHANYRSTWNNLNEPWYIEPIIAGKPIWAKIYTANFPTGPYISATASRPIYDAQNRLLGMIAVEIHLLKLGDYLRSMNISRSGQVFIVERDGNLIATSGTEKPFTLINKKIQRVRAINSPNPTVQAIARQLQASNSFQLTNQTNHFQLDVHGERHFISVVPWHDQYGLDWLVVVSVPENVFMAQVKANTRTTLVLCLAALVVSCVIGVLTSRWITQPIARLNRASEAIASGSLDQTVEPSNIQELNGLSRSFNHMTGRLNELFTALEHSKTELEDRVAERTAEFKVVLAELQRTQSQAIQSEKMSSLGQLVAGVAHEINNPVNFIHGNLAHVQEYTEDLLSFVQFCQQNNPCSTPEIQKIAETIDLEFIQTDLPKILASMKLGTDRICQIVLSLRNFSRMDEAEFKSVDIHEGIDSTLLLLQHRLKAKPECPEIEVIKHYGPLPLVECYAGQLNQVFMNILTNSIDAIEEGYTKNSDQKCAVPELPRKPGRITIRTRVVGTAWVEMAIADSGVGMPKDTQQRMFDPFFTTKPLGKGTGMGMSICYQIITEKHSGVLDCFSIPDEGTEFVIRIPLQQKIYQGI